MLDNKIGYISLLNFGENVANEIKDAVLKLKSQGMKKLIFDKNNQEVHYLKQFQ